MLWLQSKEHAIEDSLESTCSSYALADIYQLQLSAIFQITFRNLFVFDKLNSPYFKILSNNFRVTW